MRALLAPYLAPGRLRAPGPPDLAAVLEELEHDERRGISPGTGLCVACSELLGVAGVAIMLRGDDGPAGSFGASSDVVGDLEDLQFVLGEGPGVDAHASGRAVLEPVLGTGIDEPGSPRWPVFAPAAVAAGMAGAFALPLRVGAIRLGALGMYRDRPGSLTPGQLDDARLLGRVITAIVLALESDTAPGVVPTGIDHVENLRAVVHQASGMVSEQLDIGIADAFARLRAHAYAAGCPVNDVAADVVAGTLRIP